MTTFITKEGHIQLTELVTPTYLFYSKKELSFSTTSIDESKVEGQQQKPLLISLSFTKMTTGGRN